MLTPEELRGIEERVSLRLSDSADVDVLLTERRELLLQVDELREALYALLKHATKPQPRDEEEQEQVIAKVAKALKSAGKLIPDDAEKRKDRCPYVRPPAHGGKTLICDLEADHGGLHHAIYAGSDEYFETHKCEHSPECKSVIG